MSKRGERKSREQKLTNSLRLGHRALSLDREPVLRHVDGLLVAVAEVLQERSEAPRDVLEPSFLSFPSHNAPPSQCRLSNVKRSLERTEGAEGRLPVGRVKPKDGKRVHLVRPSSLDRVGRVRVAAVELNA